MSPTESTAVAPTLKTKVFISYSRKDLAFVDRLAAGLQAHNITPTIDRTEIYAFEAWWKRIQTLVAEADTVIFVLSPDAVNSDICRKEVDYARSLRKRFAPVVARSVADEMDQLPAALGDLNFVFFDDPDRFEPALAQLVGALRNDIDWVRKHTQFGLDASAWVDAGKPNGLLLRSPRLEEVERWIVSRPSGAPAPTEDTQTFIVESRQATSRRRKNLTASLAAAFVLAIGLAGFAFWQRNQADEQRRHAVEQEFIAKRQEVVAKEQRDAARAARTEAQAQTDRANARTVEAMEQKRQAENERRIAEAGRAAAKGREALTSEDPVRAFAVVAQQIKSGQSLDWTHTPDLGRVLLAARRESHLSMAFKGNFLSAALSDDGRIIGLLTEDSVQFREVDTGSLRSTAKTTDRLFQNTASPGVRSKLVMASNGELAAASAQSQILVFSIDEYKPVKMLACKGTIGPFFFIDARRLLWTCGTMVSVTDLASNHAAYVFDLGDDWKNPAASNEELLRETDETFTRYYRLQAIAFDPVHELIATHRELRSSRDGHVLLAFRTGKRSSISRRGVTFSPDGKYVSVGYDYESIVKAPDFASKVWDIAKRRPVSGFYGPGERKPNGRQIRTSVLTREKQAVVIDDSIENIYLEKHDGEQKASDYDWIIGDPEKRLTSALSPLHDKLAYIDGYYIAGTDSVIFVADKTHLSQGAGILVLNHEGSFRVFRGEPELPFNFHSRSANGLFLTSDDHFVYVWRASNEDFIYHLSNATPFEGEIAYSKSASVYVESSSLCRSPRDCRPIKLSGKHIDVLDDNKIVSLDESNRVVTMRDETGDLIARLDYTPFIPASVTSRQNLSIIGLTRDGACLVLQWDESSGSRHVLVRRTAGDQALVADVRYDNSALGSMPEEGDKILGSQIFIGTEKQRYRVDCKKGTKSELEPRQAYSLNSDGSYIVSVTYTGEIDKNVAVAAEIREAGSYNLVRRIGMEGLVRGHIDVESSGARYILGNTIFRTSDGAAVGHLGVDYDTFDFLPGQNVIIANRGSGEFGNGERIDFFDATTLELMTTEDGYLANGSDFRMIGPDKSYVLSAGVAHATPNLQKEAEIALKFYLQAGLSSLGE